MGSWADEPLAFAAVVVAPEAFVPARFRAGTRFRLPDGTVMEVVTSVPDAVNARMLTAALMSAWA